MAYVQGSCYGDLSGGHVPERILMHGPKGHRGRPSAAFQLPVPGRQFIDALALLKQGVISCRIAVFTPPHPIG